MTLTKSLAATLRAQIESGELSSGATLPPMRELAARHGVSEITVRGALRELKGEGWVESRARVGTVVSSLARRGDNAKPFALVMPALRDTFFARIAHGAQLETARQGRRLLTLITEGNFDREGEELGVLASQVAGVAVFSVLRDAKPFQALQEKGVPVVFIDRPVPGVEAPLVSVDNARAGHDVGVYVAGIGREVFAISGPPALLPPVRQRLDGMKAALMQAGQEWDEARLFACYDGDDRVGFAMTRALLATRPTLPISIVAINDAVARGAYTALREAGLRVPQDCAVVGFGDAVAPLLDPPLSSVWLDEEGMGRTAMNVLGALARGEAVPPLYLLKPRFVSRGSGANADFCRVSALLNDAPRVHRGALQPV